MPEVGRRVLVFALVALVACRSKPPEPTKESLFAALESGDDKKVGEARLALIRMGAPAVPRLAEMLQTGTPVQKRTAANLLWAMGPASVGAVDALTEAAASTETDLRLTALMALENYGPASEPAVQVLVKALQDTNPEIRRAAVETLGAIGPGARPALPTLKRMAKLTGWSAAEDAIHRIQGTAIPAER